MTRLSEKLTQQEDSEIESVEVCPLCHGRDTELMFWTFDRRYHRPGKFGTFKCIGCGLIRLSPRPTVEAIGSHYPEEYGAYDVIPINEFSDRKYLRNALRESALYSLGYNRDANFVLKAFSPVLSRFFLDRATYGYNELFPRFVEGGSALEIGCGYGVFLAYLKRHGWKVAGVDLSPHAAARTKEQFGIEVFVGQVGDAPFEPASFDYVHLSHIVEHFFDPLESLKQVFTLLKPGGRAYVELPNAAGVGAEISGEYWYGWDAPRHLFMFTPETLSQTIEKAGFVVEKLRTVLWDSFAWAETFKREEELGEFVTGRPLISGAGGEPVERWRAEASKKFESDPLRGDFISLWATKPTESLTSL